MPDSDGVADERRLTRIEADISSLRDELRSAYKEVLQANLSTQAKLDETRTSIYREYITRSDFQDRLTMFLGSFKEREEATSQRMDRIESVVTRLMFTCISLAVTIGGGILVEVLRAKSGG